MADIFQLLLPLDHADPQGREKSERNTLQLSDAEAREAALDIQRSWIVEAPAGSGKTGLLIQRLLKLLAFGEIDRPGDVLAITFTRKATAELRTRVLEQLTRATQNQPLPPDAGKFERETRALARAVLARDGARGWRLLDSPHQLNIRTIDAFGAELTGGAPLLAGGAGGSRPVEDAFPLYELAAVRTFHLLGGNDPALTESLRSLLLRRDSQIEDCIRLIAGMLANREQWGALIPLDPNQLTDEHLDGPVRQHLEQTLDRILCEALTDAQRIIPEHLLGELAEFAARLSTAPGHQDGPSTIASCAGRPSPPGTCAGDLEHWLALLNLVLTKTGWRSSLSANNTGVDLPPGAREELKDLIAGLERHEAFEPGLYAALCAVRELPGSRYPDEQWNVAKDLFRVLRRSLIELQLLFAERKTCDFTELALTARALLRGEPDLLGTPGGQLAHVLVDEMQDTSAGQYDLLELLTRGWDGRTQTVFLVGDPKQSIYLFRQARVARFLRTQAVRRFGEIPIGPLRLTANFRSQAELVDAFNDAFSLILPSPDSVAEQSSEILEVPFVAADPIRGSGARPGLHWHARNKGPEGRGAARDPEVGWEEEDSTRDTETQAAKDAEACSIRGIIENFRARSESRPDAREKPQRSLKIAVLARSRPHLAPLLAEFATDRGKGPLPYRAINVEALKDRPEVLDLLALTRALLHPGDRVAWLAVLHSPVCGLGLADLLRLTGEGKDADAQATVADLIASRAPLLSPDGQRLLQRAWITLSAAQNSLGRTLFSTQVERTWRSLGADAPLGKEQLGNARRFLHLLHEAEADPEPLSLDGLGRRLEKLYAEPSIAADAVELMTIHNAKGLEWDLVLVPGLHRCVGNDSQELLRWLERDGGPGAESEMIFAPIVGKGEDATGLYNWLGVQQKKRRIAELKRLFYVACTRAREELHLFGAAEWKEDGTLAAPAEDSLLRAAWAAAEPIFREQLARTAPAAQNIRPEPVSNLVQLVPRVPRTPEPGTFALAAGADVLPPPETSSSPARPLLSRLPLGFDPRARFRAENGPELAYLPATALRHSVAFARPEGSFGARAFGNTVHRFLEFLSRRLAVGVEPEQLLIELPGWHRRIETAFRAEGLSAGPSQRETTRALGALEATLRDAVGRWLLCPREGAQSEWALHLGSLPEAAVVPQSLRADRVFLAGPEPLSEGMATHLWIVDFKTSERGGRPVADFLETEKAKYEPQMRTYAAALKAVDQGAHPIVLALFYPLLTQMSYWPYSPKGAS